MTRAEPHMAMGNGAEFDIIRRLQARWGPLAVGLGDDAAEIEVPRGERMVVSTDASLDEVHFERRWLTWREVGYRAVTAALSDLAAMAAAPIGVLLALAMPKPTDRIDELADGIGDAVRAADTVIRGGNLARADKVAITTTVLGTVSKPLRRNAARVGHLLYVTGRLGGPAAAIRAFQSGQTPDATLRERFARPVARIAEARWLVEHGALAGIDISDGLGGDAGHLARASQVGIECSMGDVPRMDGVTDEDLLGGEEYELLVTSPATLPASEFERRFDTPLTLIGHVVPGDRVTFLDGGRVASPRGHDHFLR